MKAPLRPKIIMVSGFGYSGSGALLDFLSEHDELRVPLDEFRLIRDPDGISSLEHALVHDWSLLGADRALKRFRRLVRILGRRRVRFLRYGMNWNRNLNGRFFRISDEYLASLIDLRYAGHGVHDHYLASDLRYITVKSLERFRIRKTGEIWLSSDGGAFLERTQDYFERLAEEAVRGHEVVGVVLNQAASALRPQQALEYVRGGYVLVVDRDPRDVYVESKRQRLGMFMPSGGPEEFVKWYRRHRLEARRLTRPHPRVMQVQFEDLVLSYRGSTRSVREFLGLAERGPSRAGSVFDPNVSAGNVGIWERYAAHDEIEFIRSELEEYLWNP